MFDFSEREQDRAAIRRETLRLCCESGMPWMAAQKAIKRWEEERGNDIGWIDADDLASRLISRWRSGEKGNS